jgi:hypothetical protein
VNEQTWALLGVAAGIFLTLLTFVFKWISRSPKDATIELERRVGLVEATLQQVRLDIVKLEGTDLRMGDGMGRLARSIDELTVEVKALREEVRAGHIAG